MSEPHGQVALRPTLTSEYLVVAWATLASALMPSCRALEHVEVLALVFDQRTSTTALDGQHLITCLL